MADERIHQLTEALKAKEGFLAFYVWNTANQYGVDLLPANIEDIIGDAYLKAATKLQNDQSLKIDHYYAWFVRILFLTTMNSIRKKAIRSKTIAASDIQQLNETNHVYETFDKHHHDPLFKSILQKNLTEREYEILKLNVEGYSYGEIANSLELTADNVRQIRLRAIKKLKKVLQ